MWWLMFLGFVAADVCHVNLRHVDGTVGGLFATSYVIAKAQFGDNPGREVSPSIVFGPVSGDIFVPDSQLIYSGSAMESTDTVLIMCYQTTATYVVADTAPAVSWSWLQDIMPDRPLAFSTLFPVVYSSQYAWPVVFARPPKKLCVLKQCANPFVCWWPAKWNGIDVQLRLDPHLWGIQTSPDLPWARNSTAVRLQWQHLVFQQSPVHVTERKGIERYTLQVDESLPERSVVLGMQHPLKPLAIAWSASDACGVVDVAYDFKQDSHKDVFVVGTLIFTLGAFAFWAIKPPLHVTPRTGWWRWVLREYQVAYIVCASTCVGLISYIVFHRNVIEEVHRATFNTIPAGVVATVVYLNYGLCVIHALIVIGSQLKTSSKTNEFILMLSYESLLLHTIVYVLMGAMVLTVLMAMLVSVSIFVIFRAVGALRHARSLPMPWLMVVDAAIVIPFMYISSILPMTMLFTFVPSMHDMMAAIIVLLVGHCANVWWQ